MDEPADLALVGSAGGLIVIANDHPGVGVANLISPQDSAVLGQIQGDVLLGGLDLGAGDVQQILVPLVDGIAGAADSDGNGAALGLVHVGIGVNLGERAGDSLGSIGLADLPGLAFVGGVGNDRDIVADLHVLQGIVGVIVAVLDVREEAGMLVILLGDVDRESVVAGDLAQIALVAGAAAVGLNVFQGDEVSADALDLHQLGAGDDNIGDEVGVHGADIDLNGNAVVGQVGDLSDGGNARGLLGLVVEGAGVIADEPAQFPLPNAGVPAVDGDLSGVVEGALPDAGAVQTGDAGGRAPVADGSAVIDAPGVIVAQAQSLLLGSVGVLQVGHLLGVGEVSGQLEGADGDLLPAPLVGGMAILIVGGIILVVLQPQILEVLFAELQGHLVVGSADDTTVDVGVDLTVVAGHVHGLSALHRQSLSAGHQSGAAVGNHGGLQGVQSQLASLLTIHGSGAIEVQAIEQASHVADPSHVHGPAGVNEALDLTLVAQRAQQHLSKGEAGQRVGRLEGAVTVTVDDTSGLAVADDAREGVAGGNIRIRRGGVGQIGRRLGANQQGDDDLRRGSAGQLRLGTEGAVLVTGDNTDPVQNGNGFLVLDLVLVGEIPVLGGSRANRDQRHGHDQCENQGQEFLH